MITKLIPNVTTATPPKKTVNLMVFKTGKGFCSLIQVTICEDSMSWSEKDKII